MTYSGAEKAVKSWKQKLEPGSHKPSRSGASRSWKRLEGSSPRASGRSMLLLITPGF